MYKVLQHAVDKLCQLSRKIINRHNLQCNMIQQDTKELKEKYFREKLAHFRIFALKYFCFVFEKSNKYIFLL